jgi:hypothetical protein
VDSDRVVDTECMGAIDGSGVLDIDEAVALLDPEEDVVLVLFDKVTSPAPSC